MNDRKKKKCYDVRKSINIMIDVAKILDELDELEYNLTGISPTIISDINVVCHDTKYATTGKYEYLPYSIMRITRHIGDTRTGPLYICIIGKINGWTYSQCSILVLRFNASKAMEICYSINYEQTREEIVETIIKSIKENL